MEKFQNKYRIPSARLAGWDYSQPGFYFITICTRNRNHFFGEINNSEMYLNEIGIIANHCWASIPNHFLNVTLGEFVIMPNHVHGIIIINDPEVVETGHALSRTQNNQQSGHALPPTQNNETTIDSVPIISSEQNPIDSSEQNPIDSIPSNETGHALSLQQPPQPHFRFRNQGKNTISAMVGSFKSAVTKLSKPINIEFGWQTRFHDHIIRNHDSYLRISNYILNNPANWKDDKFYN